MAKDVESVVRSCTPCCLAKPKSRKQGLYQPLPTPTRPWESIAMDFLGGLPTTKCGYDSIFVVVDRFSKMAIMMPCRKTTSAEDAARLFFRHVFCQFGLPKDIVSDRDSRFLGKFWRHLWEAMDTRLKFSTAFHPQTDGQTEVVNRTIVHTLRAYHSRHPKTWDEGLPFVQFAYNSAIHSSLDAAPFEVCLGYLPASPFALTMTASADATTSDGRTPSATARAKAFVNSLRRTQEEARRHLASAQQRYKARHDRHRVDKTFVVGDRVWLYLAKERLQGEGRKLKPVRYGPFTVLQRIGANAYRLDLPPYMAIHATANVDNLRLFEPSRLDASTDEVLPPLDDLAMDSAEALVADAILETKTRTTRQGQKTSYRIGRAGQRLHAAKWFSAAKAMEYFPHLCASQA